MTKDKHKVAHEGADIEGSVKEKRSASTITEAENVSRSEVPEKDDTSRSKSSSHKLSENYASDFESCDTANDTARIRSTTIRSASKMEYSQDINTLEKTLSYIF